MRESLNQSGLKDGLTIVHEYISVREYRLAFEHVLYMIDETDIKINKSTSELIKRLSNKLKTPINGIINQLDL